MQVLETIEQAIGDSDVNFVPEVRVFKVVKFCKSKERNSLNTAQGYADALARVENYLADKTPYNIESILPKLLRKKENVYELFDNLISHMTGKAAVGTIKQTVAALRAYVQYYDVEINNQKFKNKVTVPEDRKEDERPIDPEDAIRILNAITSLRFKAYSRCLKSGGMRAVEGCAIRFCDVDFNVSPTKIYMRAKYAKNKLPREIYIADEDTIVLKQWYKMKYGDKGPDDPEDLIFAVDTDIPKNIYQNFAHDFRDLLKFIGMDQKKESSGAKTASGKDYQRNEITLHSFRRLAETVIEDNTSANFADYILGHKKSPYYGHKEPERRKLYKEKCLKQLTFFDYSSIEKLKKEQESEKDAQIENLQIAYDDLIAMVKELKEKVSKGEKV